MHLLMWKNFFNNKREKP